MASDRNRIRELAIVARDTGCMQREGWCHGGSVFGMDSDDVAFVAAASPDVITALLDELDVADESYASLLRTKAREVKRARIAALYDALEQVQNEIDRGMSANAPLEIGRLIDFEERSLKAELEGASHE